MATKKNSKKNTPAGKAGRGSGRKALRAKPAKTAARSKTRTVRALKARAASAPKARAQKETMNRIWCGQLLGDAKVRRWLIRNVGEHAIHVIQEFEQEMSDEDIARKADVRASDVRVVLNKLHSHGLASYYRSRDKNSGWYSYVWRLNGDKAVELMDQVGRSTNETPEQTEIGDARAGAESYCCTKCQASQAISFDDASARLFRCAQCGSSLSYVEKKP